MEMATVLEVQVELLRVGWSRCVYTYAEKAHTLLPVHIHQDLKWILDKQPANLSTVFNEQEFCFKKQDACVVTVSRSRIPVVQFQEPRCLCCLTGDRPWLPYHHHQQWHGSGRRGIGINAESFRLTFVQLKQFLPLL